jgi:hypothetical protein
MPCPDEARGCTVSWMPDVVDQPAVPITPLVRDSHGLAVIAPERPSKLAPGFPLRHDTSRVLQHEEAKRVRDNSLKICSRTAAGIRGMRDGNGLRWRRNGGGAQAEERRADAPGARSKRPYRTAPLDVIEESCHKPREYAGCGRRKYRTKVPFMALQFYPDRRRGDLAAPWCRPHRLSV